MELKIQVLGAFDTLAQPTVPRGELLAELESRGLSVVDSELALEKALVENWLERAPNGGLQRGGAGTGGEIALEKPQSSTPP